MTSHLRPLPTIDQVRAAITAIENQTGRRPSTLALARQLGLANTTFRRHFPEVCAELAARATPNDSRAATAAQTSSYHELQRANARLRRANRDLAARLEVAIAAIQQLSIDNARQRSELEAARNITHLPPSGRRSQR